MNTDERIANIMKNLKCTKEEALEIIADDDEVDSMSMKEVASDLTAEQKTVIKKATNVGTRKTTYQFTKRERKPNEEKRALIKLLENALDENVDSFEVTNIERQIDFVYNGTKYRIVLSAPRTPKDK